MALRAARAPGPTSSRCSPSGTPLIAPDLLGHGESAKPRGDYSLGAYASGVRDLLAALGSRSRDRRRALARRRRGDAVRLPVPGAHRAAGAGVAAVGSAPRSTCSCGSRPCPAPSTCCRFCMRRRSRRRRGVGRSSIGSGCGRAPTWRRSRAASPRSATSSRRQAFVHTVRRIVDPSGQRVSPAIGCTSPTAVPLADRLGRARPDHPGRARLRAHEPCRAAASRCSAAPATSRTGTTRIGSRTSCATSSTDTEPAQIDPPDPEAAAHGRRRL